MLAHEGDRDEKTNKRKHGSESTSQQEAKLEALRERLRELRAAKSKAAFKSGVETDERRPRSAETAGAKRRAKTMDASDSSSDSDSASSSDSADSDDSKTRSSRPRRSSKHAPTLRPSNRPVTRKRVVIPAEPRPVPRDPRFAALPSSSSTAGRNGGTKAYSFLASYQANELSSLKSVVGRTKPTDPSYSTLKAELQAGESRAQARAARERERDVIREHRREEREKVANGKKPFYLKKTEMKKRALVKRWEGLKGSERQKVVKRRVMKNAAKEKKAMPEARRDVDG